VTEHVATNAWLAKTFLGVQVTMQDHRLAVAGTGFKKVKR
jgi:hypothetical protein